MRSDDTPTRADIPYVARNYMMVVTLFSAILTWPLAAAVWQDLRPGVIEVLVGLLFAPLAARGWAEAWISYVSDVALASREQQWLKWIPLLPGKSLGNYMAKSRLGVLGGGIVAEGVTYALWRIAPGIQSPWAHWSTYSRADGAPFMSMGHAVIAYAFGAAFLMTLRTLRWYNSLPCEEGSWEQV